MTISPILQNIPCTLVTGFLGAGKTSVINQLLTTKPVDARWALLINEFGRIGIDGMLLASTKDSNNDKKGADKNNLAENGIAISEVSGGCICCTSQLPLQIALTQLLSDHRPQRLIIEPTGLAHPRELLRQLSAPHWQTALNMQAVITVVAGIQWQNEKYRTHEGFQAHVRAADVVVINRYEQLSTTCQQDLQQWIATFNPHVQIIWAPTDSQTTINSSDSIKPSSTYSAELTAQLNEPSQTISQQRAKNTNQSRISLTQPKHLAPNPTTISASNGSVETNNELPYRYHDTLQGMFQQEMLLGGWRLPAHWIFDADSLQQWLLQLPHWQRIKGVVHTLDGWLQFNFTPDSLTITTTSAQIDSRLEIILLADTNTSNNSNNNLKIQNERLSPIDWESCDRELMALIL